MKRIILCIAFLAFISCASASADSAPIGTITSLEGVVDIARNSQEAIPLKEKDSVYLGDRLRTKSYSKAEVIFTDKSLVRLAPNSCMTIDEYTVSNNNKREHATLNLSRGKVEAIVSKTGKPETFVITTPNAKGSVKGSDVFVFYQAGRTGVLVKDGLMSLSNMALPETKLDVGRGDASLVSFDKTPAEVRAYLDAELTKHEKDVKPSLIKKWVPGKGAASMNATLISSQGEVRIYKKGSADFRAINPQELIKEGDTVQTGSDGKAQIRLDNGNILYLEQETELSFTTLKYDPSSGSYQNSFESKGGKIKAVVERLNKSSTFQVKTPTALCGARGTVMYLNVQTESTQAFYEGGGGYMTNTVSNTTQELAPGQNSTADVSGSIAAPTATSNEQRSNLDASFSAPAGADTMGGLSNPTGPIGTDTAAPLGPMAGTNPLTTGDNTALQGPAAGPTQPFNQLPFDQATNKINNPTTVTILYNSTLAADAGSSSTAFFSIGPCPDTHAEVNLFSNNTWTAHIEGTFIDQGPTVNWFINLENATGVDHLYISGSAGDWGDIADTTWTASVTSSSGLVGGKHLQSATVANGIRDAGNDGTFDGSASGNWY